MEVISRPLAAAKSLAAIKFKGLVGGKAVPVACRLPVRWLGQRRQSHLIMIMISSWLMVLWCEVWHFFALPAVCPLSLFLIVFLWFFLSPFSFAFLVLSLSLSQESTGGPGSPNQKALGKGPGHESMAGPAPFRVGSIRVFLFLGNRYEQLKAMHCRVIWGRVAMNCNREPPQK